MPNPVPTCAHIKANGEVCGSPAVKGAEFCYHHSAVKTALGKVVPLEYVAYGAFTPIPFVFPEDRASMQINYFLLLQALNEQRIDLRTSKAMMSMLKAMSANLGKECSLVETSKDAASKEAASDEAASNEAVSAQSQKRPASSEKSNQENKTSGDIDSLLAASSKMRPEACFLNAPPVPASVYNRQLLTADR